jgi:hypothetical protein
MVQKGTLAVDAGRMKKDDTKIALELIDADGERQRFEADENGLIEYPPGVYMLPPDVLFTQE